MSLRVARIVCLLLASVAVYVGVWAVLAPASFFRSFPAGRGWVAADGPYNKHLVRDVGALYLALLPMTVAAALRVDRARVRLAGGAWLAFGAPHLAYHAVHVDLAGLDQVLNVAGLGATVLAAAALVLLPPPHRRPGSGLGGRADVTHGGTASST